MAHHDGVETRISSYFDDESSGMRDRHEDEGIPQSMQFLVDQILSTNPEIVLDVGSGPGSLIMNLLDAGVNQVVGIDLSEEMNTIAKSRIAKADMEDCANIQYGNYLSAELEEEPDAISLHRVLCCHPDRESMLETSARYQPDTIGITVPRDWKVLRLLLGIFGIFTKLLGSFRPYIHTQHSIDDHLDRLGYEPVARQKEWWWVTTTYQRKQ